MILPAFRTRTSFRLAVMVLMSVCFCRLTIATETKSKGVIADGTKWETPYYIVDSGVDGPTVFLTGGIHGNEPAGFRAAEQIRQWPIVKGRLVVCPQVNIPGLTAATRYLPNVSTEVRDLNRNFPVDELSAKGLLAGELWSFVKQMKPDWVIDLHEGFEFHISHQPKEGKKRSVGSTIIYQEGDFLDPMIERALAAANDHVTDADRTFEALTRGPVRGSLARAAAMYLRAHSMILETTYKDQPISLRTRQHRSMVNSLLNDIGLIDQDCSSILTRQSTLNMIQVGLFDGPGTGSLGKENIPRIADRNAGIEIHFVGVADIEPEILRQLDVVVFPGGSGSKQARALGEERRQYLQEFVKGGGGYIGVCAGAYLCSAHYSWSLNLVDSHVFTGSLEIEGVGRKQMWYRGGKTKVDLELTDAGKRMFPSVPDKFKVTYQNGPIISRKESPEIEDYIPLAWFRSEKVRYEPQRGTMVNTPAIVAGNFGAGRVISISPHPEADEALQSIIVDSMKWVAESSALLTK